MAAITATISARTQNGSFAMRPVSGSSQGRKTGESVTPVKRTSRAKGVVWRTGAAGCKPLHPFCHALAEESRRPHDEDGDQHAEDEDILPFARDVTGRVSLEQADDHAARHSAGNVADSAKDCRRESAQSKQEAVAEMDLGVVDPEHDA